MLLCLHGYFFRFQYRLRCPRSHPNFYGSVCIGLWHPQIALKSFLFFKVLQRLKFDLDGWSFQAKLGMRDMEYLTNLQFFLSQALWEFLCSLFEWKTCSMLFQHYRNPSDQDAWIFSRLDWFKFHSGFLRVQKFHPLLLPYTIFQISPESSWKSSINLARYKFVSKCRLKGSTQIYQESLRTRIHYGQLF